MATTSVSVAGLADLQRRMHSLRVDVAGKVARAATNAGAQEIKKRATANASRSEDTGNLKRNIIVKRLRPSEHTISEMHIVTVRKGKPTAKQKAKGLTDAFYARFVEFGTVKMNARPFLRPAFDNGKSDAVKAIADRLAKRLLKEGA